MTAEFGVTSAAMINRFVFGPGVDEPLVAYDASGTRTWLAADEAKSIIGYNSNLLPTSVTRSNGTGTLAATTAMAYDPRGNMTSQDGPLPGTADTTAFKYDLADQAIGVISPDPDGAGALKNRAIRIGYRPDGQVSMQELGTTLGQSDAAFAAFVQTQSVSMTFDSNSRPVTSKLRSGNTDYALTQVSYDALGRTDCTAVRMNPATYASLPASACTPTSNGAFGPDRISKVTYDAASQPVQLNVGIATADAAAAETLSYTTNGMLQTLIDGENNRTTFDYDGFDRLAKTRYPVPTKGANASSTTDYEQLSYDANSNVTLLRTRSASQIAFAWDGLDRLSHKGGQVADTDYGYDLLGRMLSATFTTGGQGVTNAWDALSRLTSTTSNMGGTARSMSYLYDLAGRRTRATWWDGFFVDYDRLVTGEATAIRENGASAGAGVLATFTYDDLGNRTSLTRSNGAVTTYGYDDVARLHSLTHDLPGTSGDVTDTLEYNPASQIVSMTRSNDAYVYREQGRGGTGFASNGLNQIAGINGTATSHDANGNLTAEPLSVWTYGYDAENQLNHATATGKDVVLSYDPLGRLWKMAGGGIGDVSFAYDGGDQMTAEFGVTSGALIQRTVFGDGIDEPLVAYDASGTRTWLAADERGSIIARLDAAGALAGVNGYDEYGKPATTNVGRFGYTGQAWLPEIGLDYYKARMYSPLVGRFVQPDPTGHLTGPNLYAYVLNDPVNLTDPPGLKGSPIPPCDPKTDPNCIIVNGKRVHEVQPPPFPYALLDAITAVDSFLLHVDLPSFGHGYGTKNIVCRRPLSNAEMRDLLSRFAVPGHGSEVMLPGVHTAVGLGIPGQVITQFAPNGLAVRNTTTSWHLLAGYAERSIGVSSGVTQISTVGRGRATGAAAALRDLGNQLAGPTIFNSLDAAARRYAQTHFKGC